jgi:CheY-like chemotaxis protein
LYSIEAICDAMITAASAAAYCRTQEDFLRCALQAGGDLLDVSCSVFYGAASPFSQAGAVRVNQRAGMELVVPETLPSAFTDYLLRQPNQSIISAEWDALNTLMPGFDFNCCSSLWLVVGNDSQHFGVMVFFDHAARRFDRTQQKIAGLVSGVISLGLQSKTPRNSMQGVEPVAYQEYSKLVAGVARDLINPLAAVFGYVELLKCEPGGPRTTQLLARMEEQVEKARKIVSSFSAVSETARQGEAESVPPVTLPSREGPARTITPRRSETPPELAPAWQDAGIGSTIGARILLVQRSEAVLEFQRSVLSALGAEVIAAFSGTEALDLLRSKDIDAIVLDDELDESFSSKRLVWWVRENRPELADRMLLTVSKKPSAETREILEIAMLPHVAKPLEVLELYSRAQQILQSGRSPQTLQ